MDMTIRHLRVFVTVCRERGMTRAARRPHMARRAISIPPYKEEGEGWT